MKDIPMFTTEYGIAALSLREIPYQQKAYITLLSVLDPEKLVAECASFCRMCGAERVYARADQHLERYPLYTAVWQMQAQKCDIPGTDAMLFPVQKETLDHWRGIYNEKILHVPNAAWMTEADGNVMLNEGSGYYVHRDGCLLGIGKVAGNEIQWIAAVQVGAGADVLSALASLIDEDIVTLTVASENKKAVSLYQKLGFVSVRETARWHQIF